MKQLNFGSTNGKPNNPNKTVVHCSTQELAQKVLRIADSEWHDGGKMYEDDYHHENRESSCYNFCEGTVNSVEVSNSYGYTILPAEEFIRLNTDVKNPFRIGDKVFDIRLGHGEVIADVDTIGVQFFNIKYYYKQKDLHLLSFTEYTLQGFSQERPLPEIKDGQLIYVRSGENDVWEMRFFSHWETDNKVLCFEHQMKSGNVIWWPEYSLTNPLEEK